MITLGERTARNGAATDGNDIFRVGHLVVQTLQYRCHLGGDGTIDQNNIGLTRAVACYFKAETCHIIASSSHSHKLDTAAAGGKSKRPQRVAASPVDESVEAADHDADAVLVELLNEFFERFIVLKLFVRDIIDDGRFLYCHSNAPFFQA